MCSETLCPKCNRLSGDEPDVLMRRHFLLCQHSERELSLPSRGQSAASPRICHKPTRETRGRGDAERRIRGGAALCPRLEGKAVPPNGHYHSGRCEMDGRSAFALDERGVPHSGHRGWPARKSYPQFGHRAGLYRCRRFLRSQVASHATGRTENRPITHDWGTETAQPVRASTFQHESVQPNRVVSCQEEGEAAARTNGTAATCAIPCPQIRRYSTSPRLCRATVTPCRSVATHRTAAAAQAIKEIAEAKLNRRRNTISTLSASPGPHERPNTILLPPQREQAIPPSAPECGPTRRSRFQSIGISSRWRRNPTTRRFPPEYRGRCPRRQ